MRLHLGVGVLALLSFCALAHGQSRSSSGMSSSGFGSSSSSSSSSRGFSGQVGSLGGFRSNSSTFGQPSSLLTGNSNSQMGSDAFGSTRQDALSINRATGANSRNSSRNSSQFNSMGGGFNNFNSGRGNFSMNQNMQMNQRRAHVATQIAFDIPKMEPAAVVAAAQSPIVARTVADGLSVNLQVRDGVAVLTGNAATKRDAALAAAIISLEPGIRAVDNRIVVKAN